MHPEKQSPDARCQMRNNPQLKMNLVVEVVAKGGVRCSKISGGDVGLVIPTRRPRTIVRLETTPCKKRITQQYCPFKSLILVLESIRKCLLGRKVVWVAEAKTPRAKGMADIAHILQILANKKLSSFATKLRK